MTTPNFELEFQIGETLKVLAVVLDKAKDLTPVFQGPINDSVDELFRQRFASEGAYGGARWRELAPVTQILRQRPGHGLGGIGWDTGRLRASLTKRGAPPDGYVKVTPHSLERGTTVPYAKFFDGRTVQTTFVVVDKNGRPVPLRRRVPTPFEGRPLTPDVPSDVVDEWTKIVADFLTGGRP